MKTKLLAFLFLFIFVILAACKKTDTSSCCVGGKVAGVDSSLIAMPDIFTPNGDGANDLLFVRGKNLASLKITVSRKSGTVFESTDMVSGWDGTYKGKPSKEKDYSFNVEAVTTSGKTLTLSGVVCIIRDNCSKTSLDHCAFDSQFNGNGYDLSLPSYESIKSCN